MKKEFILLSLILGVIVIGGCTQKNENKILTKEEIESEGKKLEKINKAPNNATINASEYPKIIGIDSETGHTLKEIYFCMDICPNYANILLIYEEVLSEKECDKIGGKTLRTGIPDPYPGKFIGCSPLGEKVIDLIQANAVKQRHENTLMNIPGVQGVGLSQDSNGSAFIEVYTLFSAPEVLQAIPTELEGIPVKILETGPIKAL